MNIMNEQFVNELIRRLKSRIADLVGAVTELELLTEVRNNEIEELKKRLAEYEGKPSEASE